MAKEWRDDEAYGKVCEQIKTKIYPQELMDAISEPTSDRSGVERWFANHTGLGVVAVQKMASFYINLCKADPAAAQEKTAQTNKALGARAKTTSNSSAIKSEPEVKTDLPSANIKLPEEPLPTINVNIQVHIPIEATVQQIDQIFASMAKHLYRRANGIEQ